MDFFAAISAGPDAPPALTSPAVPSAGTTASNNADDELTTDAFADAINARYSRRPSTALVPLSPAPLSSTAASAPPLSQPPPPPPARLSSVSNQPHMKDEFKHTTPAALQDLLADTLLVDIRPHNAYAIARLPGALSLSVPSTLLKRPLFSLDKLTQMLSSHHARTQFSKWPNAHRILVYDADSPLLTEGGNLLGLMRKFRKEGFARDVFWLKGGFKAVWRERLHMLDQQPLLDDDDAAAPPVPSSSSLPSLSLPPAGPAPDVLRTNQLPLPAFTVSSTTISRQVPPTPSLARSASGDPFQLRLPAQITRLASASSMPLPTPSAASGSRPMSLHLPPPLTHSVSTSTIPEGKPLRSFLPLRPGAGPIDASSMPTHGTHAHDVMPRQRYGSMPGAGSGFKNMAFNPFFDNIRQNLELGGGRGSGEGIPLRLPRRVRRRVGDLPFEWLREIGRKSGQMDDASEESDSEEALEKEKEASVTESEADVDVEALRKAVSGGLERRQSAGKTNTNRKTKKQRQKSRVRRRDREKARKTAASAGVRTATDSPPPHSTTVSHSPSKSGSASPPPDSSSVSGNGSAHSSLSPEPPLLLRSSTSGSSSSDSDTSGEDLARALAMQFYKIELGEQRRLMGVMEHHSKESGLSCGGGGGGGSYVGVPVEVLGGPGQTAAGRADRECVFPFSITAGVEKGEKNRYRNIWPFEHARVRLHRTCPDDDDYMNASYVQPLGTTKRYIATQGPLPATFADFWTLCWQENVHVIVMLTREVESALVKCGRYWAEGTYGPLTLKLISTTDTPEHEQRRKEREMATGFFTFPPMPVPAAEKKTKTPKQHEQEHQHTIRRVFELRNALYPEAPPRVVTQLQYLDWPDLDVPKDPRGLLQLMQDVDDAVDGARRKDDRKSAAKRSTSGASTPPQLDGSDASTLGPTGAAADDIDPHTGIAQHALARPPVLLHCSAGVGRTGGFIAVDAILDGVRREMRKRRELREGGGGSGASSSSSASRSPLSSPMEVDRASESPVPEAVATGMTLPMSAGPNEVHVPVVGFGDAPGAAGQSVPMDVDEKDARPGLAGRRGTIRPSSGLLSELRTAQLKAVVREPSGPAGGQEDSVKIHAPVPKKVTLSDASASSSSGRSTSFSGVSLVSSSLSSAPSLVKAVQAVDASLGDEATAGKNAPATERMASWRSAVTEIQPVPSRPSSLVPTPPSSVRSPPPPRALQDTVLASPRGMAFDYLAPRRLHDDASPPLLSTYSEPVRRVIEDMREQRMSLCQSLRQYVFVHRAIIEGALAIVDEERERERERERRAGEGEMEVEVEGDGDVPVMEAASSSSKTSSSSSAARFRPVVADRPEIQAKIDSPSPVRARGLDSAENVVGLGAAFVLAKQRPSVEVVPGGSRSGSGSGASLYGGSPLSPRTKRQASPTELVSETAKGVPRLMKRPSIKRRAKTPEGESGGGGGADGDVMLGSLVLSSPTRPESSSAGSR